LKRDLVWSNGITQTNFANSIRCSLMRCRILIVDDHEVVRRGIRTLLSARSDWEICGEAADGQEAIEKAKALHPEVVLMDIFMPRMNGLDATRLCIVKFQTAKSSSSVKTIRESFESKPTPSVPQLS
jgi:CheY-like chemotaxis protein